VFFRTVSTETVPNVTGHHFFDVFLYIQLYSPYMMVEKNNQSIKKQVKQ